MTDRHGGQELSQALALTSRDGLTLAQIAELRSHPDPGVRGSLAQNFSVPTSAIEAWYPLEPDVGIREFLARHVNAPTGLRAEVPMDEHSLTTIGKYLDEIGAGPAEREAVWRLTDTRMPHEPLGAVVSRIRDELA